MNNNFQERASEAAADNIYNDGSQQFQMYEDDGNFFIEQDGFRAVWGIGQDVNRSKFNREANRVLEQMGYSVRYHGVGIV